MKYMVAVLLLVAAMSAQNAPSTNKGRHLDIPAISREANGAIVSIIMSDKDGRPIAQGSGFLISKDGHVVTNYHVIRNGSSAVIKLPSGAFFAVDGVLATDKDRDVAVIKAHGNGFRTLTLGDSDRLQVGEEVVAIGNPLSLESTVSNGIVSAIRTVEDDGAKFVQITAPISHGSSGGPLFNTAGEVVGITTSGYSGGGNLNFAIPVNDVKPMLRSIFSKAHALPDEPEPDKNAEEVDAEARAKQAAQAAHEAQENALKAQHEAEIAKAREKEANIVKALNDKLNAAKTAANTGDYDTAIALLNAANQMDPSRDLIWFKLGDYYRMSAPKQTDPAEKQTRLDSAVEAYRKAIDRKKSATNDKDPNAAKNLAAYYNNLADALYKAEKTDEAVKNYEQAAQIDPSAAGQFYFNIGAVLTNAGRVDDAIAAFDRAIAADPNKADAYYERGWCYQSKNVFDMALADYNKVLELNPKYTNAVMGRARLFDSTHEFSKAIAEYEKAIGLDPRRLEAYNSLAWLLATTPVDGVRNGAKAVEYGQKALALADKGESFMYMDTLAAAYAEAGRFADAVALQSKAISLLPKDYDTKGSVAFTTRLQFYKENKPFRGPTSPSPQVENNNDWRVRRPTLGVLTIPISPELADEIGLPADYGLLIVEVTPGGSAGQAGLRGGTERAYLGDIPIMLGGDLIVAIDDDKIQDEQDLAQMLNNHRAGDTVKVTIYRNKKKMDVQVPLGEACCWR